MQSIIRDLAQNKREYAMLVSLCACLTAMDPNMKQPDFDNSLRKTLEEYRELPD